MIHDFFTSFLAALLRMAPLPFAAALAACPDSFFSDPALLFGTVLFFLFCVGCVRLEEQEAHHNHHHAALYPTKRQRLEEGNSRHVNMARDEDDDGKGTEVKLNGNDDTLPDQSVRKRKRNIDDDGEAERNGPLDGDCPAEP